MCMCICMCICVYVCVYVCMYKVTQVIQVTQVQKRSIYDDTLNQYIYIYIYWLKKKFIKQRKR